MLKELELRPTERQYLEALLRKGIMAARQFKRATLFLELDRGNMVTDVLQIVGVSRCALKSGCIG